jgi:hypothetical protein
MRSFAAVIAALWAGTLCTVCCVVAPVLFATLAERQLAGELAARFFAIAAIVGACSGVLLVILIAAGRLRVLRKWSTGVIVATAGLPVLSELALGPMMNAARAADDMSRFGMLHGIAAVLFFAACLGSIAVVVLVSRPAE